MEAGAAGRIASSDETHHKLINESERGGSRPRIRRLLVVADAPVSVVPCRPVMCRSLATLRRPVRGKSGSVWVLAREPPRSPSLLGLWWVSSELTMRPAAPASMVSSAIWLPGKGYKH